MELAGFKAIGEILRSGVYALVWQGKVVYIGKSRKMLSRIYTHRSQAGKSKSMFTSARGIRFDDVFICPCPLEKLDALEKDMIDLYKPRYNINHKSPHPITTEFTLDYHGVALVLNRQRAKPQVNIIIERRL
jgi:excinuclease UvrABC nuclease subunit